MFRFVLSDRKPDIDKDSCFPQGSEEAGPRAQRGDGQLQQAPGPKGKGPLRMWTPLCQSGACFHYQGHIPEIPWWPGTYYREIKAPKENTHLRPGFFIFIIGRWVWPRWGRGRKGAAGQSISMGVRWPEWEGGAVPAQTCGAAHEALRRSRCPPPCDWLAALHPKSVQKGPDPHKPASVPPRGPQLEADFCPLPPSPHWGHLEMSRNIFVCHNRW